MAIFDMRTPNPGDIRACTFFQRAHEIGIITNVS